MMDLPLSRVEIILLHLLTPFPVRANLVTQLFRQYVLKVLKENQFTLRNAT